MIRFPHSLVAVLLLSLSTSPLLAQDGPTTTERPMYGAEFEFAGRGNRIPLWENQRFENYRAIMAVVAEHYGGRASDITKAEWTVPHPSGEGERKLFRAE
jgi:hypothetical protein